MQIFAIIDIKDRDLVLAKVQENYEGQYYDSGRQTLFVATDGETSKEVAVKLGLSGVSADEYTSGVVVLVGNYWGHYDPQLWAWLQAKIDSNGS